MIIINTKVDIDEIFERILKNGSSYQACYEELMQSLLTQPDQDETATISAGNTNKEGGYSVPLGVQLRGSDALDGDSESNLLTYLQAPYGLKETDEHFSTLPNLPPNMLE